MDRVGLALLGVGNCKLINKKSYIPALDGLRAISIIFVLVFHLNEKYLPGGYIGVDVFFVISGYIITKNILSRSKSNKFNFIDFYWKRVARLLPAAAVVGILTLIFSYVIYGPNGLFSNLYSFLSSLFWVSNVYFYANSGYFDPVSLSNPYLHFWSLSVEEQFYIFWPLLISFVLLAKFYRHVVFFIASLLAAYFIYKFDSSAMFYLMPARVFQFSAGALVACIHLSGHEKGNKFSAIGVTALGFVLLVFSAVFVSGHDYDIILSAFVPTLGASFILFYINSSFSIATLGNDCLTWIGRRAYTLYLVHWPLTVFYSYYLGPNRPLFLELLLVLSFLAAAELLHKFVEEPVRVWSYRTERKGLHLGVFAASFAIVGAVSLIVAPLLVQMGRASEGDEQRSELASAAESGQPVAGVGDQGLFLADVSYVQLGREVSARRYQSGRIERGCHLGYDQPFERFNMEACLSADLSSKKVLLIADSYGAETIPLLERWLPSDQIISIVTGGCVPIYPESGASSRPESCQRLNRFRYDYIAEREDLEAIVIVSNWRHWRERDMVSTFDYISSLGLNLFVVGARPQYSENIPELLDSPIGPQVYNDLSRYHVYDVHEKNAQLSEIVGSYDNSYFLNVLPAFCDEVCPALMPDGQLIYMDSAHTGPVFANYIADHLEAAQPGVIAALQSVTSNNNRETSVVEAEASTALSLRLECEAINESLPAITRRFASSLEQGAFAVRLGGPDEDRYEYWDGTIGADGTVSVRGEYIEGLSGLRDIQLDGRVQDNGVVASGNRGVRSCELFFD